LGGGGAERAGPAALDATPAILAAVSQVVVRPNGPLEGSVQVRGALHGDIDATAPVLLGARIVLDFRRVERPRISPPGSDPWGPT
jgi:hypothetical protein